MNNDTFIKTRCYCVIGYSYSGVAFTCGVFNNIDDAEEFIRSQKDGWTYKIEYSFYRQRNLPF